MRGPAETGGGRPPGREQQPPHAGHVQDHGGVLVHTTLRASHYSQVLFCDIALIFRIGDPLQLGFFIDMSLSVCLSQSHVILVNRPIDSPIHYLSNVSILVYYVSHFEVK